MLFTVFSVIVTSLVVQSRAQYFHLTQGMQRRSPEGTPHDISATENELPPPLRHSRNGKYMRFGRRRFDDGTQGFHDDICQQLNKRHDIADFMRFGKRDIDDGGDSLNPMLRFGKKAEDKLTRQQRSSTHDDDVQQFMRFGRQSAAQLAPLTAADRKQGAVHNTELRKAALKRSSDGGSQFMRFGR